MNAKERLRAYLEQRRELGESEMTLDALDVDDVLRMLGALQGAVGSAPPASDAPPRPARRDATVPRDEVPPEPSGAPSGVPAARGTTPHRDDDSRPPRDPAHPIEQGDDWRNMMQQLQGSGVSRPPAAPPSDTAPADAAGDLPAIPSRGTIRLTEGVVFPIGRRVERPAFLAGGGGTQWGTLDEVAAAVTACRGCALYQTATHPVPGTGNPQADILVVGEAPGEREDATGEPFVGPAGELLTKILGAIQLSREDVYICNVLKHRPPGNRNPLPDEIRACAPFLQRQIDLVQPKVILALGAFAAQTLLGTKLAIGTLRQQLHWYQGIPLIATYHPAALLRNDAWKRPTWEDVKLARRVLDATLRT